MFLKQLSKFYPVILITVLFILTTSLLIVTQNFTRAKIDTQKDQETLEMLRVIFPEAGSYTLEEDIYVVYKNSSSKTGYAFLAKGIGYKEWFSVLVGLEDESTIRGINILSHGETFGWGYSEGPAVDFTEFAEQYTGLEIANCALTEDDGMVDAVTGASLGSSVIVNTIRETTLEKIEVIKNW